MRKFIQLTAAVTVLLAKFTQADIYTTQSGYWDVTSTWQGNVVPTSADVVRMMHNVTIRDNGSAASTVYVGQNSTTALDMSSGSLNAVNLRLANNNGDTGTFNMNGGTLTTTGQTGIGGYQGTAYTARGYLNISGGTANLTGLTVGLNGYGEVNISGAAAVTAAGNSYIGNTVTGTGVVNVTGGSINFSTGLMTIGRFAGGSGQLNISGGSVSFGKAVNVGTNGTGGLKITGTEATITFSDALTLGANATYEAELSAAGVDTITAGNNKNITLDGALILSALDGVSGVPESIVLFQTQGTGTISGTFDSVDWGNLQGNLVYESNQVRIDNLSVIPEPVTVGLFGFSALVVLVYRRVARS